MSSSEAAIGGGGGGGPSAPFCVLMTNDYEPTKTGECSSRARRTAKPTL
jgi:hypothetical protein